MQFEQEMMYPYKQTQFMQSLLNGLSVEAQNYAYTPPSGFGQIMSSTGGIAGLLRDFGILGGGS
jgi:hypothetical protein